MTEPTDAELDELRQANSGRLNFVTFSEFRTIARAVLAKWSTPPAMIGEPVFAFRRKGLDDFCTCTEKRYAELSLKPKLFETRIFYTTPQPTQAQAGTPCRKNPFYHGPRNCSRGTVGCCEDHGTATQAQAGAVPLTQAQIVEAFCELPHQVQFVTAFDQGVRFAERHHGITGGQHGAE